MMQIRLTQMTAFFFFQVYLISCITGSFHGLPDYTIAYVPNYEVPAIYIMKPDGSEKKLFYQEDCQNCTIDDYLFFDKFSNIYYLLTQEVYSDQSYSWQNSIFRIDFKTRNKKMIYSSRRAIYDLISNGSDYVAFRQSGFSELIVVDTQSREFRSVSSTGTADYRTLCWTTDPEELLLYKLDEPNVKIYKLNLANSFIYLQATLEDVTAVPAASPDAGKIAYLKSDNRSIGVLDLATLQSDIIVASENELGVPGWSYDNNNFIFIEEILDGATKIREIKSVNITTKEIKTIISTPSRSFLGRSFPADSRFCIKTRDYDRFSGRYDLFLSGRNSDKMLNLTSDQNIYNSWSRFLLHDISPKIVY